MKFERNIEELPSTSRQIPAIKMSNLFGLSAGSIMEGQVEVVYTIQRYKDRIKTICSVEEYLSLILLLCDSASLVYTVFHLSSHFSFETSFTTRINVSRTHFQWNSILVTFVACLTTLCLPEFQLSDLFWTFFWSTFKETSSTFTFHS